MRSLSLILMFCELSMAGSQIILDEVYDKAVYRAILLAPEEFNPDNAEALSRAFLQSHSDAMLVKFQIATEKYQAYQVPKSPMATVSSWLRSFERLAPLHWETAESVSLADSAVMRIRDKTGKINRVILKGEDPLFIATDSADYEILHLDLARAPAGHLANLRVFLRALGPLDARSGEDVVRLLVRKLAFQRMTVTLRADPWFATEVGFPDYHPFSHGKQPPTQSQYDASPTVYCSYFSGKVVCSATEK